MADPVNLDAVLKKVENKEPLSTEEHKALNDAWAITDETELVISNGEEYESLQSLESSDGGVVVFEDDIERALAIGDEKTFAEKLAAEGEKVGKHLGNKHKDDGTPLTKEEALNIWNSLTTESKKEIYKGYFDDGSLYTSMDDALQRAKNEQADTQMGIWATAGAAYGLTNTKDNLQQAQQAALDGNANKPAASPSEEDDEDKKNEVLGEGNGILFQCYLLNGVTQITNEFNSSNDGTYADRLRRIRLDRPEKFFNSMGFPKDGERLYQVNSGYTAKPDFDLYLVKGGDKIDLKESMKKQSTGAKPKISSINVSFNGTDPASARSDIKVDIEITIKSNLSILGKNFDKVRVLQNGKWKTIPQNPSAETAHKIMDMVVRPEFIREGGDIKAYERSQYHPEYNRCELVLTSVFDHKENEKIKNSVSFGLTMVDHEVDYSITPAEGPVVKLRLSYYSYVQSYLNLPYMDVLGGKEVLNRRMQREKTIQIAVGEGCDEASIHRAKKAMKSANVAEIQNSKTRIFEELKEQKLIWRTDVSDSELEKVRKATEKGEVGFYGNKLQKGYEIVKSEEGEIDKETLDYSTGSSGNAKKYIYFVSLGDLICSLADIFYENKYPASGGYDSNFVGKLEIKFLLLDILVKNPEGKDVKVNLADIPISMEFLGDFLLENYFKKEVQYASFMTFIRNLVEKAVSNMLKKTCFMEKPWSGNVRVTSFRALKTSWESLSVDEKYVPGSKLKNIGAQMGGIDRSEDDYYTYIIVHASNQNYQSELIKSVSKRSSDVEKEFPILRDMGKAKTGADGAAIPKGTENPVYGTDIGCFLSFKKTDSTGLRESRYFQYQADEFVAIGNVYDCTINFKNNLLNWFLPGHIVIVDPYVGTDARAWNDAKSIGNRLGLTGFYLVTKVEHKYGGEDSSFWDTTLQTKWIASVTGNIRGRKGAIQNINDGPKECDINIFADELSADSVLISTTPPAKENPPSVAEEQNTQPTEEPATEPSTEPSQEPTTEPTSEPKTIKQQTSKQQTPNIPETKTPVKKPEPEQDKKKKDNPGKELKASDGTEAPVLE